MYMVRKFLIVALASLIINNVWGESRQPKREFRGSWIQCVNGQFQGMGRDMMQATLRRHLDALQRCHVNAVFFQVRPEADALYCSQLEPWSRFLSGQQGVAPLPYWDPLEWMIEECHSRGMELHAWINPYRAKTAGTMELATTHPYVEHPENFFRYGKLILFNPGLPENRDYICEVVTDIVSRYDVDGLHMDDYFYPYPEAGVQIPDQETFRQYGAGFSSIQDWRRDNVSRLIHEIHETIKRIKPWVKFGVSPFGIYHNLPEAVQSQGLPGSDTRGLQNYDDLYADVLQWINQGWVDYNIPQIYWEIGHKTADYETLIRWWSKYASGRPLIIGQDVERTVKAADLNNPQINQLPEKMRLQRSLPGIQGNCLWYSAAVANNTGNIATALEKVYQPYPALVPTMPFKDNKAPKKVKGAKIIDTRNGRVLVWLTNDTDDEMQRAVRYVIYRFEKGERIDFTNPKNIATITPHNYWTVPASDRGCTYVVTALDRMWNESKGKKVKN
ncbi:MAG: family 10 glycosylhydrolase [Bacteroidaceae bacterium]|nr:family 10 glycosylhydrolase [Bacteroidaceae bacterium]